MAVTMIALPQNVSLSPDEYIEAEKNSPVKHEYNDGAIYAMAGASDEHVTIAVNLTAILRSHLRGSSCRIYSSDMKVNIVEDNCYYYPDVVVSCDPRDRQLKYYKQYPKLIIEVLSESTEAKDRGQKFHHYQNIETLQEYVLVSQETERVEVFRRNQAGLWVLYSFYGDDQVELASLGLSVDLAEIYENVEFIPENASKRAGKLPYNPPFSE